MKINIVKPFGFCAGVKRAIQLVEEALKKYNHVYCLGKLIHNENVIEELGINRRFRNRYFRKH